MPIQHEIVIGLVSPLGCKKSHLKSQIKKSFELKGYVFVSIDVTELIYNECSGECRKSLDVFIKMELCNLLRKKYKGTVAALIVKKITEERLQRESEENEGGNEKIIYWVDQIKNEAEYEILSHVYGLSYIQLSLFSNVIARDSSIQSKLKNDKRKKLLSADFDNAKIVDKYIKDKKLKVEVKKSLGDSINSIFVEYEDNIQPDCAHNLIDKDYIDSNVAHKKSGQQICKLFHKSHYFLNLDVKKAVLEKEINKFIMQYFGEYKDYPTQDEFGMAIAYHTSYRSNFPGDRHIGAAIIARDGEVISVGSIRAPNPSSNTKVAHQDSITDGYSQYKKDIDDWLISIGRVDSIDVTDKNCPGEIKSFLQHSNNIKRFLKESIEFHPCTHAEMAALLDAAKLGVSIRNATMYTTTFPCHLCAKDIITAGISRVVYIEAYPKSKSKNLYPSIIDLNHQQKKDVVPFDLFSGVSPSRYHYVYSLKNKGKETYPHNFVSPFLKYECPGYYKSREDDICNHFDKYIDGNDLGHLSFLDDLLKDHPASK